MSALIASPHWPFVWPAYAITIIVFAGLSLRAWLALRAAARRARDEEGGA